MKLDAQTLCETFAATVARRPVAPALRAAGSDAPPLTWSEYDKLMRSLAAGLAALGVERGELVGLMLTNRPEFHVADTALFHLGAIPFSIYNTSSPEQVKFLFEDAGARFVITESQFVPTLLAAAERGAPLEQIICIDGAPEGTVAVADVVAAGDARFDLDAAAALAQPEDTLTVIYTSGTTGPPKCVIITHANMLAQLRGVHDFVDFGDGGRNISWLPTAHISERWTGHYTGMLYGRDTHCVADPRTIVEALTIVRPERFGSVPRIWEKLRVKAEAAGGDRSPEELRELLGLDCIKRASSGAAPTPVDLLEYFAGIGVNISEQWGMSETAGVGTLNPPGELRFGSVGKVIPGAELQLARDGELLIRGEIVSPGYRNRPDLTAEAIDRDGWLHTGDVARIDDDGYVWIVDRKKDIIISAAGKNMSPANIETALKAASPAIGQACCVGDGRPYNVALVVLEPEVAFRCREDALAAVESGVADANATLSRVEQIKRFHLVDGDWLPGGDELTPTMKLKRREIAAKYASEIEALYG